MFDYSPTVSDVGALLYLLAHPGVEVVAITVPVTGEAGCDLGIEVTLGILALTGNDQVPIACDPEPEEEALPWNPDFLRWEDSLLIGLPESGGSADPRPAHQLLADVASASEEPVVLVAVAPLTNVARALDRHPSLAADLERIVIMGGAVDVAGNVADTKAEWNFWIDVTAAAAVFRSGVPITLVPLDATNDVRVPNYWKESLEGARQTDSIAYLERLVRIIPTVTSGFFYLWDELAAAAVAGSEELMDFETLDLIVVEEPGDDFGSVRRETTGAEVLVATNVPDSTRFYEHFLSTLAEEPAQLFRPASGSRLLDEDSVPELPGVEPTDEEILFFWVFHALRGDSALAASVVAPGAPWVGPSSSANSFVEGSVPFGAFDITAVCVPERGGATCNVLWNDLWLDAYPALDAAGLRVEVSVADGVITAFRDFTFRGDVTAAFESHLAWLQAEQSEDFAVACGSDVFSAECSGLLVASVEAWVAANS